VPAGFEELLEMYQKEIYRFAYRMTRNGADAADVLQDTFLRAFRAFPRLPADANHRAWLYRIASRSVIDLARDRKARRTFSLGEARHLAGTNGDHEAFVEARRLTRRLGQTMQSLSPRQRIALIQRRYEGLSYRDVAATLGCSEQAARAHVYQAMEKIRRGLTSPLPTTGRARS